MTFPGDSLHAVPLCIAAAIEQDEHFNVAVLISECIQPNRRLPMGWNDGRHAEGFWVFTSLWREVCLDAAIELWVAGRK